ncbi:MAG TPA: MarR family transcriptional regulator [Bacteroidota bacterium]|jgi:DNA-binding MarR family transcriptional regulator|nr:MarR family transcriptional regulator [Bacteroidota bacterium]
MRLEEAIEQKKFKSQQEKLIINIIYTYNWLKEYQTNFFKKYDLTMQQYNILRILRGAYPEPLSQKIIKKRMLDKMSDVSRLVDRLLKKKLVTIHLNMEDKRCNNVLITELGLNLLKEIHSELFKFDLLFNDLTPEEIDTLNTLLDKIHK